MRTIGVVAAVSKPTFQTESNANNQQLHESVLIDSGHTKIGKIVNRLERGASVRDTGSPSIASMIRHQSTPRSQQYSDDNTQRHVNIDPQQSRDRFKTQNTLTSSSSSKMPLQSPSLVISNNGYTHLHKTPASDDLKKSPNSQSNYAHGNTSRTSLERSPTDTLNYVTGNIGRKLERSTWSSGRANNSHNDIISSSTSPTMDESINIHSTSSSFASKKVETPNASTIPLKLDEGDNDRIVPKKPSDYKRTSSVSSVSQNLGNKLDINLRIPSLQSEVGRNANKVSRSSSPMIQESITFHSTSSSNKEGESKNTSTTLFKLEGNDDILVPKKPSDYKRSSHVSSASQSLGNKLDTQLRIPSLQSEVGPNVNINKSRENSRKPSASDSLSFSSKDKTAGSKTRKSWKTTVESQVAVVYRDEVNSAPKNPSPYRESPTCVNDARRPEKADNVFQSLSTDHIELSQSTVWKSEGSCILEHSPSSSVSPEKSKSSLIRTNWKKVDIASQIMDSPTTTMRKREIDSNHSPKAHYSSSDELNKASTLNANKTGVSIEVLTQSIKFENNKKKNIFAQSMTESSTPVIRDKFDSRMYSAELQPSACQRKKECISQGTISPSGFQLRDRLDETSLASTHSHQVSQVSKKWHSKGNGCQISSVIESSLGENVDGSNLIPRHRTWQESDVQIQTIDLSSRLPNNDSESAEAYQKQLFSVLNSVISEKDELSRNDTPISNSTTIIWNRDSEYKEANANQNSDSLGAPSLSLVIIDESMGSSDSNSMYSLHQSNTDSLSVVSGLHLQSSVASTAVLGYCETLNDNEQQIKVDGKSGYVVTPESVEGKSSSIPIQSTSTLPVDYSDVHFEVNFGEDPSLHHSHSLDTSLNLAPKSLSITQPPSTEEITDPHIATILSNNISESNAFYIGESSLNFEDELLVSRKISDASVYKNESFPSSQVEDHHLIDGAASRDNDSAKFDAATASISFGIGSEGENRSSSPSLLSVRSKVAKFQGEISPSSTAEKVSRISLNNISTSLHRSPARVPFNIPNLHFDLASSSWRDFRLHLLQLADRPEWIMPALTRFHPENGASPLHTAVWKSPTALTLILIQLLSLADESLEVFSSRDRDGNTALHLMCANLMVSKETAKELDLTAFEELLKYSHHLCNVKNTQGDTPLHLLVSSVAARSEIPSVQNEIRRAAELLINSSHEKAGLLKNRDQSGATPLHSAISSGANKAIVLHLINLEPEVAMVEDEKGLIPLHYAAALSRVISPSIIKELIHAYEMGIYHKSSQSGDIPIHIAISNFATLSSTKNSDEALEEIFTHLMGPVVSLSDSGVERSESALLTTNVDKSTPLHTCALFDAPAQVIAILMKHPTASKALSLQNCFGATALHLTCAQSSVASSIIKAVLLGSEEAASVQDKLGRTALHVCAQNIHSNEELVRFLIHLHPGSLKVKMLSGSVPLQLAVKTKANLSVVKALYSAEVSFSNLSNKHGNTLLHDAVAHQSSLDVVRFLMEENSEAISTKNSFGNIPLHCAVLGQARSEIIECLLKSWPDGACVQNRKLETALHLAVDAKSIESIMPFLEYSPNAMLILNEKEKSPIDTAKEANLSDDIIRLMLERAEEWSRSAFDTSWVNF